MIKQKGGHKRPYKQKGRKPIEKSYKSAMRDKALDGKSFNSDGNMNSNCSPSGTEAGKHMYYGYRLQDAKK